MLWKNPLQSVFSLSVILSSTLSCHLEFPPDHLALTSTLSLPDSGELGKLCQFKKEIKKYAEGWCWSLHDLSLKHLPFSTGKCSEVFLIMLLFFRWKTKFIAFLIVLLNIVLFIGRFKLLFDLLLASPCSVSGLGNT